LQQNGSLTSIGAVLVAASSLSTLGARLLDLIALYHRDHPIESGISREEARERVFSRAAPGVFERVVTDLVQSGRIVATDRIGLAGHRVDSNSAEAALRDAVVSRYRESGLRPPDQAALAASLEQPVSAVAGVVALLVRQRTLVRVDTLVFHEASLRQLRDDVQALRPPGDGPPAVIDVAMFKDRYGVTRKYAIPLLEYLDRERITKRVGDGRVVI
jgi:selenocysteine-specific elongation factor